MSNHFREALETGEFLVTLEFIPGRGAHEDIQLRELAEAERIYQTGLVHAISITDNPGGNPALLADTIAEELHAKGMTTLVHFTCKDRNRNQFVSQLYSMERRGMENLLTMTGDSTYSGWNGRARPVFDLDSVQVLQLITDMNKGLEVVGAKDMKREQTTHFFAGTVVTPFKWTEAETLMQYLKLEKKILSGAQFIITQVGFDARKMEELLLYLRQRGYTTPVLANIYLTSVGIARYMKAGNVPGAYISDSLMSVLQEEAQSEDKGREARYLRAAKMIAVARGLGYQGVHIGGIGLTAEVFTHILQTADELQDDWRLWARELQYGQPEGFYLYEAAANADGQPTGLNSAAPATLDSRKKGGKIFRNYGISRFFHYWVLTKNKRGFPILKKLMGWRERKKGLHRRHGLEHTGKALLYGCLNCGDCGLEAAVYSCPMSQCPKCQRNGPCGGSANGWCEVYPEERYCIYFKAYHRLKRHQELQKLDTFITPPNNWDLFETSGWANYTHDRDNAAHRLYLPPHAMRAEAARHIQEQ
ncbi:MAG: methylenetetrahydrofolate reductase C-terminal domain-containing protein [Coriobacteriia bacterium]|nr:methylenetetrahydrofolate reductase C-terminal domain-containing protein [Coriobacteriia bacterium]